MDRWVLPESQAIKAASFTWHHSSRILLAFIALRQTHINKNVFIRNLRLYVLSFLMLDKLCGRKLFWTNFKIHDNQKPQLLQQCIRQHNRGFAPNFTMFFNEIITLRGLQANGLLLFIITFISVICWKIDVYLSHLKSFEDAAVGYCVCQVILLSRSLLVGGTTQYNN